MALWPVGSGAAGISSANQSAPSGPAAIPWLERASGFGRGYSVTIPVVVIRPIVLRAAWVNHNAPSEPAAMAVGMPQHGIPYSVITPLVVIRPIRLGRSSVNHRAPSGPATIL